MVSFGAKQKANEARVDFKQNPRGLVVKGIKSRSIGEAFAEGPANSAIRKFPHKTDIPTFTTAE